MNRETEDKARTDKPTFSLFTESGLEYGSEGWWSVARSKPIKMVISY